MVIPAVCGCTILLYEANWLNIRAFIGRVDTEDLKRAGTAVL
jgi:hypothetical protein